VKKLLKNPAFLAVSVAIATLLIGYISNQLPALKDLLQVKNLQDLEKVFAENRIAIALFMILVLLYIWFTYQQVRHKPEEASAKIDSTIRARLLKAETTQVKQRLRNSLHNLLMLDLKLEEQPQQVGRNPLQGSYTLSVNNTTSKPQVLGKIADLLYRSDIGGRLLILGQPGEGKTTTLLGLAEELGELAKLDGKEPIPMIFELSAWRDDNRISIDDNRTSILDWLVLQLKQKYNLAPGISRVWLERGEILPLLDGLDELGLDELGLEKQRKCIRAINKYLAEDAKRNLVVCCREEEYLAGEEQLLELHGAVCLQELSDGQIRDYLTQLQRGDLWQSVQNKPEFLELARSPLLLSMMVVAYQGQPIRTKEDLFNAYIDRRFDLVPVGKREFSRPQIIGFLVFLAKRLQGTQTEFLIENIKPSWLQNRGQILVYKLILYMIFVLIFEMIYGLFFGLAGGLKGLIFGLILGLIYGLFYGKENIKVVEEIVFHFKGSILIKFTKNLLISILIYWLFFGLIYWLIGGLIHGLIDGLIDGLILGLILGLHYGFGIAGGACIEHFSLRLVLWYNHYIPWNYGKFLNRAAERCLIQQVGGRYRFIHRLLLEHFADMA
jgi:hypothetical protein